jgi:basic membrane protein A
MIVIFHKEEKMKKFTKLAALSVAAMGLLLSSCATTTTYELALITDIGDIDDKSFNQGAWEGLKEFADANGKSVQYYRPAQQGTDEYLDSIELAVSNGAKVIVTPGFLFETPIFFAQDEYPTTKFILLDGVPNDGNWGGPNGPEFRSEDNVMSILYAEEQAGFLAGYAAVREGYRSLGFMGGLAVPAVVRFGIGFAQGAQFAASELSLANGEVTLRYHYTGDFAANPKNRTTADNMYQAGTEVIFAAGGAVGQSVMASAEAASVGGVEKKVIGVDINQGGDSPTVITSAMKGLGASVKQALTEYYAGSFRGGEIVVFDASNDGVGLPTDAESFRFETFTLAQYNTMFTKLANDTVIVSNDLSYGTQAEITGTFNTILTKVSLIWVA